MSITKDIQSSIEDALTDASVVVTDNGGGHFALEVTSPDFAGKNTLAKQRLVLKSIKHLMAGDAAPVHAIDHMKTHTPD